LTLANHTLEPIKCAAQCVLTAELVRSASAEGFATIANSLRNSIATATDAKFFAQLSVTPVAASAGTSASAARADFATALDALQTGADAKIFFIVDARTAKRLSLMADSAGGAAFPQMSPTGGTVGNVQTLVSDGLPTNTLYALDAAQIATGAGAVTLDASRHALVQIDSAPPSPPVASNVMTSLWQENKIAIRLERFFGVELLRTTAAAAISGVNYGGGSP
jgi:hypothetical protein